MCECDKDLLKPLKTLFWLLHQINLQHLFSYWYFSQSSEIATCSTGYGALSLYDGMECFLAKLKLLKTMIFSNIHPENLKAYFWFLYLLHSFSLHLIAISYIILIDLSNYVIPNMF